MTPRQELLEKLENIYMRCDHRRPDVNDAVDHYINAEMAVFHEHDARSERKIKERDAKIQERDDKIESLRRDIFYRSNT
jgi:hypothetical protein